MRKYVFTNLLAQRYIMINNKLKTVTKKIIVKNNVPLNDLSLLELVVWPTFLINEQAK